MNGRIAKERGPLISEIDECGRPTATGQRAAVKHRAHDVLREVIPRMLEDALGTDRERDIAAKVTQVPEIEPRASDLIEVRGKEGRARAHDLHANRKRIGETGENPAAAKVLIGVVRIRIRDRTRWAPV